MQETESIGTPNGIWTWMCRDCTVRRNEAFLIDSPGVDGGGFDIDYGNAANVVEENYAHDTQGYCVAVFGAGWVTTGSVVRNNVCAGNGRSPRLARRQGAIYLSTWNHGRLQGLRISGNRIFWDPPDAAAVLVNTADIDGGAVFENNSVRSSSPLFALAGRGLRFDHNVYEYEGAGVAQWRTSTGRFDGFDSWQREAGQDAHSSFSRVPTQGTSPRRIRMVAVLSDNADSRGEAVLLASVRRQFPALPMQVVAPGSGQTGPAVRILDEAGRLLWQHEGFTTPGDLGLAVRSFAGNPDYAQLTREP
jgi:hypothetical protein